MNYTIQNDTAVLDYLLLEFLKRPLVNVFDSSFEIESCVIRFFFSVDFILPSAFVTAALCMADGILSTE